MNGTSELPIDVSLSEGIIPLHLETLCIPAARRAPQHAGGSFFFYQPASDTPAPFLIALGGSAAAAHLLLNPRAQPVSRIKGQSADTKMRHQTAAGPVSQRPSRNV
jgi:hypothetical protein